MSVFAWQDCRVFLDSADLTGAANQVDLSADVDALDATTFASAGSKEYAGGLKDAKVTVNGLWDAGDLSKPDDTFFADLGGLAVLTVCPTAGAVGDVAYGMKTTELGYQLGGKVGDLLPYTLNAAGRGDGLIRGTVAHPPGTARTTTGTGTVQQLGAVSATQKVYASLHVLSVAGTSSPSIAVVVQSAAASGFGTPHDQITFTTATAIGGQWSSAAGAITDTYWRVSYTITGSSPSFLFAVAIGIA